MILGRRHRVKCAHHCRRPFSVRVIIRFLVRLHRTLTVLPLSTKSARSLLVAHCHFLTLAISLRRPSTRRAKSKTSYRLKLIRVPHLCFPVRVPDNPDRGVQALTMLRRVVPVILNVQGLIFTLIRQPVCRIRMLRRQHMEPGASKDGGNLGKSGTRQLFG